MKPALYDDQAEDFDRRAGLPSGIPEKVIDALEELGVLGEGCGLVEIGAGTGEIGIRLAGRPIRYMGVDRSHPMLGVFRRRGGAARLVQADGNAGWPIRNGAVSAVFGFRSLHHFRPTHLAAEVDRITAGRKAVLVSGMIRRDEDGVRESMRRRMRQMLRERGMEGRGGRRGREAWKAGLADRGWVDLGDRVVASWDRMDSPEQCLASWAGKAGLAGMEVDDGLKRSVLSDLSVWALERFGSLTLARPGHEFLVLEAMRRMA